MYDQDKVFEFESKQYEQLIDNEHKYRVIFDEDDYDYVEDEELIARLDVHVSTLAE